MEDGLAGLALRAVVGRWLWKNKSEATEVSVLDKAHTKLQVINSNHERGGKDWDDCLIRCAPGKFEEGHGASPLSDPSAYKHLQTPRHSGKGDAYAMNSCPAGRPIRRRDFKSSRLRASGKLRSVQQIWFSDTMGALSATNSPSRRPGSRRRLRGAIVLGEFAARAPVKGRG
jgi:hypothetical protein